LIVAESGKSGKKSSLALNFVVETFVLNHKGET